MKFKKYELTDLFAGNADAITFKALETFSGREVFVHMLQSATPVSADALSGAGIEVIESGRYREQPFIITPVITGFKSLASLLDAPAPAPTGSSEPGEFTRLFQGPVSSKPPAQPAAALPQPLPPLVFSASARHQGGDARQGAAPGRLLHDVQRAGHRPIGGPRAGAGRIQD